ncbi:cytochrome c oxidase accessory protein CcoG [Macromonas nakdongensis]|uniref:cytochrome c oxidase accessory protein CcoG n=1 Tax=Macromonas nakdongensis TaxID=1843082 RepID=UPI000C34C206|nr:cytochrome c oxidase accessory protein CcoG [Macromonas nakdongensis]
MHKVIPIQPSSTWQLTDKIQAREVSGQFARWRWTFFWLTQAFFYGLPWLDWNGRQAVLFDLAHQRFFLFEAVLFPQDLIYLAGLLVVCALLLFFATAVAGRVWCGFACPQTVYTSLYMWIENRFEGSHQNRKRLDQSGWTLEKLGRRGGKHLAWLAVGLWTGLTFVGYFTPVRVLGHDVLHLAIGFWPAFWTLFYGTLTYLNAGLVREKVCLHMCPYGRFQGSLMDERTLNVAYDHRRGEPRSSLRQDGSKNKSAGHCIDCTLCVQVCPTGIDIRQGLQAACIGCGLCIDACNQVMDKVRAPRGLIRLASLRELAGRDTPPTVWLTLQRPRVLVYATLLSVCVGTLAWSFTQRPDIRMNVIRDRAVMARFVEQGHVENVYRLQLMNATDHPQVLEIRVSSALGAELVNPLRVELAPAQATTVSLTARVPNTVAVQHAGQILPIEFAATSVHTLTTKAATEASTFVLPR